MRRLLTIVTSAGLLVVLAGGMAAANDWSVDIDGGDSPECEVNSPEWTNAEALINVVINANQIVATCHVALDGDDLTDLGGPFDTAQVAQGFECLVGDDDVFEDVEARVSTLVITPSGQLNVTCVARVPGPG